MRIRKRSQLALRKVNDLSGNVWAWAGHVRSWNEPEEFLLGDWIPPRFFFGRLRGRHLRASSPAIVSTTSLGSTMGASIIL